MKKQHQYLDGFVYLAHAPDLGLWKIGRTRSLGKRLASLRYAIPVSLEMHSWIHARYAGWLESALHQCFARYRRKGEWFALKSQHIRRVQILLSLMAQYQREAGLPLLNVDPIVTPSDVRLKMMRRHIGRFWPEIPLGWPSRPSRLDISSFRLSS